MQSVYFILPGPVPPEFDKELNRFYYLNKIFNGSVSQSSWDFDIKRLETLNKEISNINFFLTRDTSRNWIYKSLKDLIFFINKGIFIHFFVEKIDVIICYGLTKTALAAYVVKLVTGAKMIIEVPCNPQRAFIAQEQNPTFSDKFKFYFTQLLNRFWFKHVDGLRCLYPEQVDGFKIGIKVKRFVFPEFVPVTQLKKIESTEDSITFLGYPWYLKGVDILIRAFNKISVEFPTYNLKIIGHITDRDKKDLYKAFVQGNEKIIFLKPKPWMEAMEEVGKSKFMILPSRTEAMGRVWLEAMAMGKPVICSAVDGIPCYVKHEKNGLLFQAENVEELAHCMRRLLTDQELCNRLSNEGYRYVHQELNEENYVLNFKEMVNAVCRK